MEKVVASRITEARESRALSMEDLAESINVTRQTVSKYEKVLSARRQMYYSIFRKH